MTKAIVGIGLLCLLLAAPSSATDETQARATAQKDFGKYFCYVKNMAGMQGDPNQRYVGRIAPPKDEEKFFITLRPVSRDALDITNCNQSTKSYLDGLASGHEYYDFDANSSDKTQPSRINREWIGWECFTQDELELTIPGSNNRSEKFRSYDLRFQFYSLIAENRFEFFRGGGFRRSEDTANGNFYIQEGQCEKIVP